MVVGGLARELVALEARAKQCVPGYSRAGVIRRANAGRRLDERVLTAATVGDWFQGAVASDFRDLWRLVAVLLEQAGAPDRAEPRGRAWWLERSAFYKGLWEAARALGTAPKETGASRSAARARVREYVEAAGRAVQALPFAVPGTDTPLLTAVYLSQRVRLLPPSGSGPDTQGEERGLAAVEAIVDCLGRGRDCVLVGGPGAGKSSLLRMLVTEAAVRCRETETMAWVPVLVSAADLVAARSLPETLAAVASADLSAQTPLLPVWEPAFFLGSPLPGTHWLVLVDGVDEITDPAGRRTVLDKIARAGQGRQGGAYRFVVACRPLPGDELGAPHWAPERFELQPLDDADLPELAARWFAALRSPDPREAVRTFVRAVERTRLADLARVPLMAAMMCQLHAANPTEALPAGRTEVYRMFVELLYERQYAAGISGVHAQVRASLDRYGPTALERAAGVLDRVQELIGRVAHAWREGSTEGAVALLEGWTATDRPAHVHRRVWVGFLADTLRRSGVMVQRGEEFTFVHQTVLEYLAAVRTVGDPQLATAAYRRLFEYPWTLDYSYGHTWKSPDEKDDSYLGFLVGAWADDPALVWGLHRLAVAGGREGCRFVAARIAEGTRVPSVVTDAALKTAVMCTGYGSLPERRDAARSLAVFDPAHAARLQAEWAADSELDDVHRSAAAMSLLAAEDPDADDVLAAQAADRTLEGSARVVAAMDLVKRADPRGADLLAVVAEDATAKSRERVRALQELRTLDRERALSMLVALAADATAAANAMSTDGSTARYEAAQALAELGDPRGADLLAALVADAVAGIRERLQAAGILAARGDSRGADLLVAAESRLGPYERYLTGEELLRLGDRRAADVLAAVAHDPGTKGHLRHTAAVHLLTCGDSRGTELLADVAADPSVGSQERLAAAMRLLELGYVQAQDLLAAIASDLGASQWDRLTSIDTLIERGDERCPDLLAGQGADHTMDADKRREAALKLDRLGDRRGMDLLVSYAADTGLDHRKRFEAADELNRRRDGRGADFLAAWAADPAIAEPHRWYAAKSLAQSGDARGPDLLAAVAAESVPEDWPRFRDVHTLAKYGGGRAAELIAAWVSDPSRGEYLRIRLAEGTAWVRPSMGADLLAALAAGTGGVSPYTRRTAAAALVRLEDSRATRLLADMVLDPTLDRGDRMEAIGILAGTGDRTVADVLADQVQDATLDVPARRMAAEFLARLGDDRVADLVLAFAADTTLDERDRQWAAGNLLGLADPRCADLLYQRACDPTLDDELRWPYLRQLMRRSPRTAEGLLIAWADEGGAAATRRRAVAEALSEFRSPRAATFLAALAADHAMPSEDRRWAASLLVQRRDSEVADALAAVVADPAMPPEDRRWAAEELAEREDPRCPDLLATLAADPTIPGLHRHRAALKLTWLGDIRAADLLAAIAQDATLSGRDRQTATEILAGIGDVRGGGKVRGNINC